MKFTIERDNVLKPLQLAANVAEKRHTMQILSHVLLVLKTDSLQLIATDSEVEVMSRLALLPAADLVTGQITVPARKLLDICKNLPASLPIGFKTVKERLVITAGKGRFTLSTLPAADFPHFQSGQGERAFAVKSRLLRQLIEKTHFAMANQDVRYYLNGMLLEVTQAGTLQAVATDGHRLATAWVPLANEVSIEPIQAIMPRKAVLELSRLLSDDDELCEFTVGDNFIRVATQAFVFTSKLIDGRFPDIHRKLPQTEEAVIKADKDTLKQMFQRAAILTSEKYHGIRLQLAPGVLTVLANNPEQEEAEETLSIDFEGTAMDRGYNVTYLLDALSVLPAGDVSLAFVEGNNSVLIRTLQEKEKADTDLESLYVVMPMRV